jgi:TRAP-type mannitol/chloroaromatic compound transport system permease small subunit
MYAIMKLSDWLAAIVTGVGRVIAWLAVPLMLIIVVDITMRKLVEYDPSLVQTFMYREIGSTKLQEMEWHLHAVLFLLCLGYAYIKNAHVRVEVVREKIGPRTRAWFELFGAIVFVVPYCYVVLWYGWDFAERSFMLNEQSSALTGLPYRWIIKAMLPIGFVFLAIAALSVALRNVVYLFGPPELRDEAGTYVEHSDIEGLVHEAEAELADYERQHQRR